MRSFYPKGRVMTKHLVFSLLMTLCGSCALWHATETDNPEHPVTIEALSRMEKLNLSPAVRDNLLLTGQALRRLEDRIAQSIALETRDQAWLTKLQTKMGRDAMSVPDPQNPSQQITLDCRLTVDDLNATPDKKITLANSLRAAMAATLEHPDTAKLGTTQLPIHNRIIAAILRTEYTAQNFKELLATLEKNGVFEELVDEETGLVGTTKLANGENPEMARQWVTDTVRCGDLQRSLHPLTWPKALLTLGRFYEQPTETKAFHDIIQDPSRYLQGGLKTGVAHIFDPRKLTRDTEWFNNKRLESHGLALKAFCDTIVDGFVRGRPWGFDVAIFNNSEQLRTLTEAISSLSAYAIAIRYYDAPSAGPWEETPFEGGLTWDVEAFRAGLASFDDLMFNPSYKMNPSIVKIRAALRRTIHAKKWNDPKILQASIDAGRRKIVDRLVHTKIPEEHPIRPLDAATAFVAGSTVKLARNLTTDVRRHLRVLDHVQEGLVRDHGMLRYSSFRVVLHDGSTKPSPDSYLSKNYWIAFDKDNKLNLAWRKLMGDFGSKDAGDVDVFLARARFATEGAEAQWFMVSDVAYGYAYQASRIIERLRIEKRDATPGERALIDNATVKSTEFINRSLARLTDVCEQGYPCVKANGHEVPPFSVPEAYEFVSTLNPAAPQQVLSGAHTPLAWARASLYRALMQYYANLEHTTPKPPGPKGGASFAHI